MSLFGEFRVPADSFALGRTLEAEPEIVIEIERVAATDEVLTPYFWMSGSDEAAFEAAVERDPSVADVRRLDEFEKATLYRASWTDNIETIVYAYTQIGATILEATGQRDVWQLRMRFEDRGRLSAFRAYCDENDIPFTLTQLHELGTPHSGVRYGLTQKQQRALVQAWKSGYFDSPRKASLSEVAAELGITQQSLSQRLRRGHRALIENTLVVVPPHAEEPST
jgi:predicted DNA binding protein